MKDYLKRAEKLSEELRHPYVGTEHLLLSYLFNNNNSIITYNEFYNYLIEIIGKCKNKNEYHLYTPLLRKYEKEKNIKSAILKVLKDDNSIAYNILLSKKINIDNLYEEILNS